jgi:putative nucleotidyltransferase with HDIG domain
MNTLELLTRQILQLRVRYNTQWRRELLTHVGRKSVEQLRAVCQDRITHSNHPLNATSPLSCRSNAAGGGLNSRKTLPRKSYRAHTPVSLMLAVTCLTGAIGHRFYSKPKLDVGTKAPYTLIAPTSAKVIDHKTTEENRKAARIGSVPALKIDTAVNQQIYQELRHILEQAAQLRQQAGTVPFTDSSILSSATQSYLRQATEVEWRSILAALKDQPKPKIDLPPNASKSLEKSLEALREIARRDPYSGVIKQIRPPLSEAGSLAIEQLRAYRKKASPQAFSTLIDRLTQVREDYWSALSTLSDSSVIGLGDAYDTALLTLSDSDWQQMQTGLYQALERLLTQGISPGLPEGTLASAISVQVKNEVPDSAEFVSVALLSSVIRPNLVRDAERTRIRSEQAAQEVEPVFVTIEKDAVIVRVGEEITQSDFVLLDHFGKSQREPNWFGLVGFGTLVAGSIGIFWLVERRFHPGLRRRDHLLILLLALSTPLLLVSPVPYTSLPAIGLILGSFYGSAIGVTVVGLLGGLLPLGLEIEGIHLLASIAGGLLGGLIAGRLRSREELALLGGGVGITQGLMYLLATLMVSPSIGSLWYVILGTAALQGLAGLAWGIVALGLSPYLENLFDLVTPVRLAELANPNRPLLKRLAAEAPGTFQHTLFVATLAEAAAKALGCNVELVRTGTLYHDIGKMHDPLGFIENQMGGPNKHDVINDPWKSAQIIKKHVTEGVAMARKYRLPTVIQAFIPEHQGTMQIAYFYHQAQQIAKIDSTKTVQEEDFRYDGPIPQSRETGIVMLADSCEAALRSLKDAPPEEALNMVNKILKARWQDNQLEQSGLKREEMPKIAEIFVQVWLQFNHKRIAYPKAVLQAK